MKRLLWIGVLPLLAGCGSDRDLNTKQGEYFVGPSQQIQPPGSIGLSVSGDGSTVVIAAQWGEPLQGRYEVRDLDTMQVRKAFDQPDLESPLLMSDDGRCVFTCRAAETGGLEVWQVGVSDGSKRRVWAGDRARGSLLPARTYNAAHTIYVSEDSLAITARGAVHQLPVEARPYFDEEDNLWYRTASQWTRMDVDGHLAKLPRPRFLTSQATHVRGPWRLSSKETKLEYKRSDAAVTTIWLENLDAVPFEVEKGTTRLGAESYTTAVAFSGLDVEAYGFVPNRDLIYVVSLDGTYLIPFKLSPKEARSAR